MKELAELQRELSVIPLLEQGMQREKDTVANLRKQMQASASASLITAVSGAAVITTEITRLELALDEIAGCSSDGSRAPATPHTAGALNDSGFSSRPGSAQQSPLPRSRLETMLEDAQSALRSTRSELDAVVRQHVGVEPAVTLAAARVSLCAPRAQPPPTYPLVRTASH